MSTDDEFDYPYVLPEVSVLELILEVDDKLENESRNLTPLERAFIAWYIEHNSAQLAVECMLNQTCPKLLTLNPANIMRRKTVKEFIKQVKLSAPYSTIYSKERLLSILHHELLEVSAEKRRIRFYEQGASFTAYLAKESLFAAETKQAERCLHIVDMIARIINGSPTAPVNTSPSTTGGEASSIDRVLAQAEQLILRGKGEPVPPA